MVTGRVAECVEKVVD